MRLTEAVVTFPTVFLLITLVAVFGASVPLLILALGFTSWPATARLVRAEFLALRERDFVRAADALGASGRRVIWRHIFPNVGPVIIVAATLRVAHVILIEAGLSYLGLGVPTPTASWGSMVADGREHLFSAWWMSFFPGLCIFLTVMTYNLVGDGLRDALDPQSAVGTREIDDGEAADARRGTRARARSRIGLLTVGLLLSAQVTVAHAEKVAIVAIGNNIVGINPLVARRSAHHPRCSSTVSQESTMSRTSPSQAWPNRGR